MASSVVPQKRRPSGLTMTLDRPNSKKRPSAQSVGAPVVRSTLSRYPPVLGYLAPLTRSKVSASHPPPPPPPHHQSCSASSDEHQTQRSNAPTPTEAPTTSAGRNKLIGLFSKNGANQKESSTAMATKIKSKILMAPGNILKTALFRSRSKDSFLDSNWLSESTEPLSSSTWSHKSSVPCYVGWRPPMPLPKDCDNNFEEEKRRHRPRRHPSRLNRRKFCSESDLLDVVSESGYMAIADNRLVPADDDGPRHTLPRHKVHPPESLRVQFKLDPASKTNGCDSSSGARLKAHRVQLTDPRRAASNELKRFCGPWSDLWREPTDPNPTPLRLCEIAQL